MADELLETLEALERRGWDALCDGTASQFYGDTMTSDGLMVLANGAAMTRDQVVTALRDAPPWGGYEMADVRPGDHRARQRRDRLPRHRDGTTARWRSSGR